MSTYWVIEFIGEYPRLAGATNYCCIRDVVDPTKEGFMDWTDNIQDAIRFSRKIDAERFAQVYWFADRHDGHIDVREHMDVEVPE